MALAVHFALILTTYFSDPNAWLARQVSAQYQPVGIWNCYGDTPHDTLFIVMVWIARGAVVCLFFGYYSRLALLCCSVAMLHCCSMLYAYMGAISHTFVPGLLASVALLSSVRSPFSIDYLVDRLRRRNLTQYTTTPRVGVMLAMFSVGWPLLDAAIFKSYLGNRAWFAWVYSDHMRNTLIFQWWKFQEPLPWYLQWTMERSWAPKLMACGNIVAQSLPILGCFLVRKPRFRAFLAGVLILEICGLGLFMNMWDGYGRLWFLFAIFFIDWDNRIWRASPSAMPVKHAPRSLLLAFGWFVVFTVPIMVMTLTPHYSRKRYPIQPFEMFSFILAQKPYTESKPYIVPTTDWLIECDPPLQPEQFTTVHKTFHPLMTNYDDRVQQIVKHCETRFRVHVKSITGMQSYSMIPTSPDTTIQQQHRAIAVRWSRDHGQEAIELLGIKSLTHLGNTQQPRDFLVQLRVVGLHPKEVRLAYILGADPTLHPLNATSQGDWLYRVALPETKGDLLLVIQGDGQTWYGMFIRGTHYAGE